MISTTKLTLSPIWSSSSISYTNFVSYTTLVRKFHLCWGGYLRRTLKQEENTFFQIFSHKKKPGINREMEVKLRFTHFSSSAQTGLFIIQTMANDVYPLLNPGCNTEVSD